MPASIAIGSEDEMLALLRARVTELGITYGTLDAISGVPDGYSAKILCDPPMRRTGPLTLGLILGALGYTLELCEDAEALGLVRRRLAKRNTKGRHMRTNARMTILPGFSDPIKARAAALKRWSSTTRAQRKKIAKRIAKVRWRRFRLSASVA